MKTCITIAIVILAILWVFNKLRERTMVEEDEEDVVEPNDYSSLNNQINSMINSFKEQPVSPFKIMSPYQIYKYYTTDVVGAKLTHDMKVCVMVAQIGEFGSDFGRVYASIPVEEVVVNFVDDLDKNGMPRKETLKFKCFLDDNYLENAHQMNRGEYVVIVGICDLHGGTVGGAYFDSNSISFKKCKIIPFTYGYFYVHEFSDQFVYDSSIY